MAKCKELIIIFDIITAGIVANIKKVIRRYYEILYDSKYDNLNEIIPNWHRKKKIWMVWYD